MINRILPLLILSAGITAFFCTCTWQPSYVEREPGYMAGSGPLAESACPYHAEPGATTGGLAAEKRGSDFPHATHMENDLVCTDCHEGAEESDAATIPTAELCRECHEDPEEESETIAAFFKSRDAGEGNLRFSATMDFADLKFSHVRHAELGSECVDCHGDVVTGEIIAGGTPDFKHTCIDCHTLMKSSLECSACHDTYDSTEPPPSHKNPSFHGSHGLKISPRYRDLQEDSCFFCHGVEGCDKCHRDTAPAGHGAAGFLATHGGEAGGIDAIRRELYGTRCALCHSSDGCDACHHATRPPGHDSPFFQQHHGERLRIEQTPLRDSGCALCHDKSGCDACHMDAEPRSHTVSFKNRTHGMTARMERTTCNVCHRQSFCTDCHTHVEPRSHMSQFNRGNQNHCFRCHFPLSTNTSCYTCHRDTMGHFTLPMPLDATHIGASAGSCRVCHAPVPHADNGMNCTTCH